MKISVYATIISIFAVLHQMQAQKIMPGAVTKGHSVSVEFKENGDIYYPFEVVKGSSIYSLSKAFDISTDKIFQYNRLQKNDQIQTGSVLNIPLSRKKITNTPPQKEKFVVLTYRVKPGETIYHLSKRRMNMDVSLFKRMNGLTDDQLREGGEVILGWYVLGDVVTKPVTTVDKKEIPAKEAAQLVNANVEAGDLAEEEVEKTARKRVIGFWDKSKASTKGMFVLSDLAKPGSKIEVYFPMNNTTISAVVLAKIPDSTYSKDIEIILSPEAARRLGIIDARFSVETEYVVMP